MEVVNVYKGELSVLIKKQISSWLKNKCCLHATYFKYNDIGRFKVTLKMVYYANMNQNKAKVLY